MDGAKTESIFGMAIAGSICVLTFSFENDLCLWVFTIYNLIHVPLIFNISLLLLHPAEVNFLWTCLDMFELSGYIFGSLEQSMKSQDESNLPPSLPPL